MKNRTGPIALLQYLAFRLVTFVLQMFPIDLNLRTARLLGTLWWHLDKRHRDLAKDHLRRSYSEQLSPAQVDDIAHRCFQHWAMFAVEFLCAFRLLNRWSWPRFVEPVGVQESFELLLKKKGAILLTGHYGNFELTAYMLAAVGFEAVAVMRPLDNVYLNKYVLRTRTRHGLRLLEKFGATSEAQDILRRGGTLGFVADQDAGRKGIFVNFFGRKASTYKSVGLLAMECEVPIIVGYARRLGGRFRYTVGIERVIRPEEWRDRADPLLWITQEYTAAIEALVKAAPEQYLWIHRRWKSRPRTERQPTPAAQPRLTPESSSSRLL